MLSVGEVRMTSLFAKVACPDHTMQDAVGAGEIRRKNVMLGIVTPTGKSHDTAGRGAGRASRPGLRERSPSQPVAIGCEHARPR